MALALHIRHAVDLIVQDEDPLLRKATVAAKESDAYKAHHDCPASVNLNDAMLEYHDFKDRAKKYMSLWVDPLTEEKTGKQIRQLMQRVRQAVTDLPTPHECVPRVPAPAPDEALPEPAPDDHAQAADAALADAEPAEPCPGAAPSAALTDAASDAEATSAGAGAAAAAAIPALTCPATREVAPVQPPAAVRDPELRPLTAPLGGSDARAGRACEAPSQMSDESDGPASDAVPPADTVASEAAPVVPAVESDSEAVPAAPAAAASDFPAARAVPAAGDKRTRETRDDDSDIMPGLIPVRAVTAPATPSATRASTRPTAPPPSPPARPASNASGSKAGARKQKLRRGAALQGGILQPRSDMPSALLVQVCQCHRLPPRARLHLPRHVRASST